MQIKRQPAVNASVPHVADVFMTVPQVTVSDLAGVPLPFVVVTVLFDDGSGCNNGTTIAMLDQYTYGCASNTQLTSFVTTFYSYKAKTFNTDEYGILTLDSFGEDQLFLPLFNFNSLLYSYKIQMQLVPQ